MFDGGLSMPLIGYKLIVLMLIMEIKKKYSSKQVLMNMLKPMTQFCTAQEFNQLCNNLCMEKELKVCVKKLLRLSDHGLYKVKDLVAFESLRFKRELKLKRLAKMSQMGTLPYGDSTVFLATKALPRSKIPWTLTKQVLLKPVLNQFSSYKHLILI